jgi:hypothetical protein
MLDQVIVTIFHCAKAANMPPHHKWDLITGTTRKREPVTVIERIEKTLNSKYAININKNMVLII